MEPLMNIIVNPVKTFNQLKTEEKFPVTALIILLVLALIHLILFVPVNAKVSELALSGMTMPEKSMDMAVQMMHKLRYLTMIGGFVMYVVLLFLHALILYVIALIFKANINYSKALRLIIYCFIVLVIGDLINTAIIYFKGIDNIENMYGIYSVGANMFTSVEKSGATLYLFLSYINPFQLWFVLLLIIGVKLFSDSSWSKSAIVCLIYWLITVLFPVMTTYFSQVFLAHKGIM
jgi:hypothetical protein